MTTTINASNSGSGGLVQTADASGILALQTAGVTAVTVDASQNVGIGGGTPGSNPKLSMYGGIRFLTTEAASATYTGIGSVVSDQVSISCAGTERVRVDNSGNVKLATASTVIQNSSGRPILNQTGSILQIVSTTKTDTFSTASTSPVDITGLSLSITPSSTSSKIFITGSVCFGETSTVPYLMGFLLVRNSTSICIADAAGSRSRWTFGAQGVYSTDNTVFAPLNFLDSPATTSATTYKVQVQAESPQTIYINRGGETDGDSSITGRFTSTITAMEIAG
jgi:hypothetical protein